MSGAIWFIDWNESTTLKIKSYHQEKPISRIAFKWLSSNTFQLNDGCEDAAEKAFMIATSAQDGMLKLTNMMNAET